MSPSEQDSQELQGKAAQKACIGCESPKGEKHQPWCPVVTGMLSTLPAAGREPRPIPLPDPIPRPRRYYRNVIQTEILSDRPWGDEITDLEAVSYAITEGDASGLVTRIVANEKVSRDRMAELLIAQGSDPDFLAMKDPDPDP